MRTPLLLLAVILIVVLPSVAIGSAAIALGALAQAPVPYGEAIEYLAGKNMAVWFLALAGIAITSWTWIVKWLISQLEAQRNANADATARLLGYMEKDHAEMRSVLGRVCDVLDRVLARLTPLVLALCFLTGCAGMTLPSVMLKASQRVGGGKAYVDLSRESVTVGFRGPLPLRAKNKTLREHRDTKP